MKIRCLAVDDEPFALNILVDDLQKIPYLDLVKSTTNPLEVFEILKKETIDLLFIDIQMPSLTGIQLLKSLSESPMVIFTTAFEQYALQSYDLNVVDYLLKPIAFERLLKATNKANELFILRQLSKTVPLPVSEENEPDCCFVYSEYKEIKIMYDEILYIEGLKDYVKIYTVKAPQKPILTRLNLKAMEVKLSEKVFCRIHNSYIVNLKKIDSFQKTKINIGPIEIPIGSRFFDFFEERYRGKR
ncbi:response regulator transcription factor [Arcicella aquatica]|uniref:Response regulator transcription factor n=1 Tax=Arcicella aquatica TaxID=217141 RepID=A0ABU5QSE0_9BACT|nr:response regulator transcription factor [Arcicella aquatica]MEA5260023.1 response regulator transcription factor [Arcicella aquatica]